MVEHLKVLRMVIDNRGPTSFEGEYTKFAEEVWSPPAAGLPMWYAGVSDVAIKRAARYCDGWMGEEPEIFRIKGPRLLEEAERIGRGDVKFEFVALEPVCIARTDAEAEAISRATVEVHTRGEWLNFMYPATLEVRPRKSLLVGSPETVAAGVRDYAAAGVSLLNLHFIGHSLGSLLEQMDCFVREVIPNVEG